MVEIVHTKDNIRSYAIVAKLDSRRKQVGPGRHGAVRAVNWPSLINDISPQILIRQKDFGLGQPGEDDDDV